MSPKQLAALSLLYLALPYLAFSSGWLQFQWATLAVILLLAALWHTWRVLNTLPSPSSPPLPTIPRQALLLYLLVCTVWVYLGGAGGYGYQNTDWIKHDAILKDLIEQPWPVVYEYYATPVAQVYYIAYYLPAALIGKVAGWGAANFTLYLWTLLGTWLAALWFALHVRRATLGILLFFMLFSGLDLIGRLINEETHSLLTLLDNWRAIENWSTLPIRYSSHASQIYWVPHQALAGWLCAALTFYFMLQREPRIQWLPIALSALWSPLITLGLAPYVAIEFITALGRHLRQWPAHLRGYLTLTNLTSVGLLLLMGLFYLSKVGDLLPFLRSNVSHGWAISLLNLGEMSQWVLFIMLEFGLYLLLVVAARRTFVSVDALPRRWLVTTVIVLLLLPFYRVGLNNDLVMRASIPALFLVAVYVAQTLVNHAISPALRGTLLALVLVGSVTGLLRSFQQFYPLVNPQVAWANSQQEDNQSIVQLYDDDIERLSQYIGNPQAPFFRYLGKPVTLPAPAQQRYVLYGGKILFAGYQLNRQTDLMPGQTVELTTELHILTSEITENYSLSLRLLAQDGSVVWQEQGWPLGRPTSEPYDEIAWLDTRRITLPPAAQPGIYRFDLALIAPETNEPLPAQRIPGYVDLDPIAPIGYLQVGAEPMLADAPWAQPVAFGSDLALIGSALNTGDTVYAGDTLTVQLQWQAQRDLAHNYVSFVHLLAPDGTLVAQWDQQPHEGFLPTSLWRAGLTLIDTYPIAIPADATPGAYQLVVGLYDAVTNVRQPVTISGTPSSDTFTLTTLQIQ
jgi:hypothetical protein